MAAVADTLADWRAAWLQMWCPILLGDRLPSGREVLVAAGPAPEEVEASIAGLSRRSDCLRPGTRLVVTFEHAIENGRPSNRFLAIFNSSDWGLEIPHLCDPLPGDPRATTAWRERERILVDRSGRAVVGAVLSKRLQPGEAATARFLLLSGRDLGHSYFPMPADGCLPLPERLARGGPFSTGDLAAAFGMPPRDTMPILDELLAAGAVSLVES